MIGATPATGTTAVPHTRELQLTLLVNPVITLFVNVSAVARPTSVSVAVGNVSVPVFEMVLIMGAVKVLLLNVSAVARPTNVSVVAGKVSMPELRMLLKTGKISVLFIRVSFVFRPTSVSLFCTAKDGKFSVPPFVMDEILGAVKVLLVSVCVAAS